jgi:hypothetical protein
MAREWREHFKSGMPFRQSWHVQLENQSRKPRKNMPEVVTLPVFDQPQLTLAKELLAARVATMLGRKMEEDDWSFVYCNSKRIPDTGWSNLDIDVAHNGLGVEHKMLKDTRAGTILNRCGTRPMHPAGTRSIRPRTA